MGKAMDESVDSSGMAIGEAQDSSASALAPSPRLALQMQRIWRWSGLVAVNLLLLWGTIWFAVLLDAPGALGPGETSIVLILMAVSLMPPVLLFRSAHRTRAFVQQKKTHALIEALRSQGAFWSTTATLTLLTVVPFCTLLLLALCCAVLFDPF